MRASYKIYGDVHESVSAEMRATVDFRKTWSSKFARAMVKARTDLLPLLQEAAELRDIDLLLDIERDFMELELDHIAHARKNISSLNAGIRQIDAAIIMLGYVRYPAVYRWVGICYALSQDLIPNSDLPKDAAHKFFGSHRTRLGNVETGPLDESQTVLLDARNDNIKLARKLYIEMQRQALTVSEVREPARPYAPELEQRRAA